MSAAALTETIVKLSEADLTTREVAGAGMFDGLMEAMKGHLQQEFDKGRITGAQYAEAYISLTQSAMGQAVQYLLAKDQAYWQAILTQKQAQVAEEQKASIVAQTALTGAQQDQVEYQTDFLLPAQLAGQTAQTAQTTYQTANILPAQLGQIQGETARIEAQTDQLEYQTLHFLPEQKASLIAERGIKEYQLASVLPAEVLLTVAQRGNVEAQKSNVLAETAQIIPAKVRSMDADKAVKDFQVSDVLPSQTANYTADTAGKQYNTTHILPLQKQSVEEQANAHRAKTTNTRIDLGSVTGTMGKQKDLHSQQIISFERDAEAKLTKLWTDTWITQKTMDEALEAPTELKNAKLNEVLFKARSRVFGN